MITARPPVAVDLFSGAGGLAEGMLRAGVHVAAAVELHPQAGLTHAFNHANTDVLVGDIRELPLDQLESAVLRRTGSDRVDLVIGGPPCQGFSSAGKKQQSDPRNSLFRHYVRVVEHFRPTMFILENVPGFESMYGGAIYREAQESMENLGYSISSRVLRVSEFGVPQRRRRFVMVGVLGGDFEWPSSSHRADADSLELFGPTEGTPVVADALDDLAFLAPGLEANAYVAESLSSYAVSRKAENGHLFNHLATKHRPKAEDLIRRISIGGSIREIPVEHRGTKKLTMTKLNPSSISNTVVSMPDDMLHYSQTRILTVRESARLQSFDDDYVFLGKRTSGFVERRVDVPQYTQVGNAVPPLMGYALGCSVVQYFNATSVDLRDVSTRRDRHSLIVGSSGYSGYRLRSAARDSLCIRSIWGDILSLPLDDEGTRAIDRPAISTWITSNRGASLKWAPGVAPKATPSWMSVGPDAELATNH